MSSVPSASLPRRYLFLALLSTACLGGEPAAAAEPARTDPRLAEKVEQAWQATWARFFDERTGLFYDFVHSDDRARRDAFFPTADETARDYPNHNGWGTGMEDCAISGGVMLAMLCDRFAATGDERLREAAGKVFDGMALLGTLSTSAGFVIRGVSPVDRRSHYDESSRDQYTWHAYGLWRYSRSPLGDAARKATAAKILDAVCRRLERNVVPANDYKIGREDGTFDSIVDKMWENDAHEAARLPMIYAIGADLTGSPRWRALARRYGPEAAARSAAESTKIPYALLQQQVSLEALYQLETDPALKAQWLQLMRLVAGRAEGFLGRCRQYQPPSGPAGDLDWRSWPLRSSGGYQVPTRPAILLSENRTVREPAEAAMILLFLPQPQLSAEQLALLQQTVAQVDYGRLASYGLYYTQAAYWRAVRMGLIPHADPD